MATGSKEAALSFDQIIQAGRQRRKDEERAKEIFGRGRRASIPGHGHAAPKAPFGPSLASRVGITKRSASAAPKAPKPQSNINGQWSHDLHRLNNPHASRVSQLPTRHKSARIARDNRLFDALQTSGEHSQLNIRGASLGLSVRGASSACTVLATNFVRGTTASDLKAILAEHGFDVISCVMVQSSPVANAEIVFPERAIAEDFIARFDKQKADGQVLQIYIIDKKPDYQARTKSAPDLLRPKGEDRNQARAEVDVEDGRYGFGGGRKEEGRGLYSDGIIGRGKGYR